MQRTCLGFRKKRYGAGGCPAYALAILMLASHAAVPAEEEFSFDVSDFERKAFEMRGFFEFRADHFDLNPDSALYQLSFLDEESRPEKLNAFTGTVEVEGKYSKGITGATFRVHSEATDSKLGIEFINSLYEGYGSFYPNKHNIIDVGKKAYRWGKGIAWNPVAFVERAKDAGDPALSREGFWTAGIDSIHTFSKALQNVTLTVLAVPTFQGINEDFGESGHLNPAAKLYLLYRNTDIDFMVLGKGSKPLQFGVDFARNLAANAEIHGELAYAKDFTRRVLLSPSGAGTETEDIISYLLGLRYRTAGDFNIVLEYYRNGAGNSLDQQREFYRRVLGAAESGNTEALRNLPTGRDLERGPFTKPNPMRDYLYFRGGWREPYNLLYFEPSFFVIANLNDGSFSWTGELFYEGVENIELRGRVVLPVGERLTEYGEKPNDWRIEARVRYYF